MEHLDLTGKQMVQEAMAAFPVTLDFTRKLTQEVERRKQAECELKKAKSDLKNSRSKYKALFKAIPAGVVIVDLETGMIQDCNPWLEKLIGKSRAALKKQFIWELSPPDEWDTARTTFFELKYIGD